jgi:hypothetical protein
VSSIKKCLTVIVLILILGCSSQKIEKRYTSYEIDSQVKLKLSKTDSLFLNELKFSPYYNSKDLQKFLFQKYGKWDNVILTERKSPFLIWKDLKLLESSDQLFTVGASGEHSEYNTIKINNFQKKGKISFCSAIILNSKGVDCFNELYKEKDAIIKLFISGTENIKINDLEFEQEMNNIIKN